MSGLAGTDAVPAINTPLDFAHALEAAEGWPQTPNNDKVLVAWQQGEGAPGWGYFNPFNTTQRESGDGGPGVAGITRFTSWAQGIQGTIDALMSGHGQWYAAIRNDLADSAPASQTAHDIEASRWAGGHYGAVAPDFAGGNLERIVGTPGWSPANVTVPLSAGAGSSSTPTDATLLVSLNPFQAIADAISHPLTSAISGAASGIGNALLSFATKFALVALGAALVMLGLWRSVSPGARQQVTGTLKGAGMAAAAA